MDCDPPPLDLCALPDVGDCEPVTPAAFTLADDEVLARMAKALGHPARVRILRFLALRSTCMCGDIVQEIALAQSTVSQHLKVLKDAGLIRGEIDPPRVCYCIDPIMLKRFQSLVAGLQAITPDSRCEERIA